MRTAVALLFFLLAGCNDSTPSVSDSGRGERPLLDRAPGEQRLDRSGGDLRADLRPDGPKVPAYWKTVPGAGLSLQGHSVTLLQNGEVLIVGGETQAAGVKTYHKKTYRYLPASDTLIEAGELAAPRSYHSATLLSDGRVLVSGGENASTVYRTDTELFDPTKPAAAAWSAGPPLLVSRRGHSAVLLSSGELMISGGAFDNADPLDTVIFLKPGASDWKLGMAPVKEPRMYHVSTLLPGGKVLLSGGRRGTDMNTVYLNSLEIYDPKTGTSTLSSSMSKQRSTHSATLLDDGRVLLVGGHCGNNCTGKLLDDLYDPKTDTITPIAHPGAYPSTHLAAKLQDGRVLVTSNAIGANHLVVAFDPKASPPGWDTLPNLPHPRDRGDGCTLKDGSVLVVGGVAVQTPYTYAAELERFFP